MYFLFSYDEKRPNGCYIKPDNNLLAQSRNNAISQDSSLHFLIASVVMAYIVPAICMVIMVMLLRTTRWTQVRLGRRQRTAVAVLFYRMAS